MSEGTGRQRETRGSRRDLVTRDQRDLFSSSALLPFSFARSWNREQTYSSSCTKALFNEPDTQDRMRGEKTKYTKPTIHRQGKRKGERRP